MVLKDNPKAYAIMACAMRVHSILGYGFLYMRATRIPCALLLNFGRPQLQYDTFDLDKLPTGSVLDAAAPPQIKDIQFLPVNGELKMRSPDYSAER